MSTWLVVTLSYAVGSLLATAAWAVVIRLRAYDRGFEDGVDYERWRRDGPEEGGDP